MYLIIEGLDASGKDTQADLLLARLERENLNPLRVAEPCESNPFGKLLRHLLSSGEYPESHAALFLADRFALQAGTIVPALAAGRPVVSVRSFLSTLVYQQEHWPLEWLLAIHGQMLAKPDMVIWLEISPEVAVERLGERSHKEVYEKLDILRRNDTRYNHLLGGLRPNPQLQSLLAPDCHISVISAILPPEELHEIIWHRVRERLAAKGA